MSDAPATTTLTTIAPTPAAATPAPAVDTTAATESPSGPVDVSAADSGAAKPPESDKNIELARKFDFIAKSEAKNRKREADLQAKLQSVSEKERKIAEREAELEAAIDDPIDYYIKKGKDPVEIAKRFGKPVTEEEKRIRKLEEQLEKDRTERETHEKNAAENAKQARERQAMVGFVSEITPVECPHLTRLYDAHEVPKLVSELLTRVVDTDDGPMTELELFKVQLGRNPTNKEIRAALELEAKSRATRILELKQEAETPSATTESQSPETAPPPKNGASNAGPSGISNQHAARTSTANPPRKKTREELKAELTAQLEAEAERARS